MLFQQAYWFNLNLPIWVVCIATFSPSIASSQVSKNNELTAFCANLHRSSSEKQVALDISGCVNADVKEGRNFKNDIPLPDRAAILNSENAASSISSGLAKVNSEDGIKRFDSDVFKTLNLVRTPKGIQSSGKPVVGVCVPLPSQIGNLTRWACGESKPESLKPSYINISDSSMAELELSNRCEHIRSDHRKYRKLEDLPNSVACEIAHKPNSLKLIRN
jgi:hypothetical protein